MRQAYSGGKASGKEATRRYRFVPSTFQFFVLRPTIFFASSCKVIVSTESLSCQVSVTIRPSCFHVPFDPPVHSTVPSELKVTLPWVLTSPLADSLKAHVQVPTTESPRRICFLPL